MKRTTVALIAATAASALTIAGCSSNEDTPDHDMGNMSTMSTMSTAAPSGSMDHPMPAPSSADAMDHGSMAGMGGTGLEATANGYTLVVDPMVMPGKGITFTITKNGEKVTEFEPEQTELLHFYVVRSDLTGFQHVHPTMADDGTWTAPTSDLAPGSYRIYTQFIPAAAAVAGPLVLSVPLSLPGDGADAAVPLPAPAPTTTVDGYTVTLEGAPVAGQETELTITVSKDGAPVTDLQPYLDTYAHVTAIREGDLAFAHLHPGGGAATGPGGPTLTVAADLAEHGNYRLFIQFKTSDILHTAPITIAAT